MWDLGFGLDGRVDEGGVLLRVRSDHDRLGVAGRAREALPELLRHKRHEWMQQTHPGLEAVVEHGARGARGGRPAVRAIAAEDRLGQLEIHLSPRRAQPGLPRRRGRQGTGPPRGRGGAGCGAGAARHKARTGRRSRCPWSTSQSRTRPCPCQRRPPRPAAWRGSSGPRARAPRSAGAGPGRNPRGCPWRNAWRSRACCRSGGSPRHAAR